MATVIRMPEVLTGVAEAAIASWLAQVGQEVSVGTPLAEIETDKAVLEYLAETEGTLLQVLVEEGTTVTVGEPIAVLGAPGEAAPADASPAADASSGDLAEAVVAAEGLEVAATEAETVEHVEPRLLASPLVRRLAAERGVDLGTLVGTGPNGRIVRRDLDDAAAAISDVSPSGSAVTETSTVTEASAVTPASAVRAAPPASVAPAASGGGDFVELPLTGMRKAIARRLTESKTSIPHFYLTQDVRMDALLQLRRQANDGAETRVSVNDFVLKAVAGALRAVPEANASWAQTAIRQHQQVDIAVAVAIDGGLVTPVLRAVDRQSVTEIARGVGDMAERARAGRLKQHELEGGSFSVSNLGMYGTQEFTAIINPPHAGILAVGAAREVPVVEDGELAVATVMKVTLSADHRVIDGAVAAQWLAAFTALMEHPLRMLV